MEEGLIAGTFKLNMRKPGAFAMIVCVCGALGIEVRKRRFCVKIDDDDGGDGGDGGDVGDGGDGGDDGVDNNRTSLPKEPVRETRGYTIPRSPRPDTPICTQSNSTHPSFLLLAQLRIPASGWGYTPRPHHAQPKLTHSRPSSPYMPRPARAQSVCRYTTPPNKAWDSIRLAWYFSPRFAGRRWVLGLRGSASSRYWRGPGWVFGVRMGVSGSKC